MNIVWFRGDLRLSDNPALSYASQRGAVLPIFILDSKIGAASKLWLHHSLESLDKSLRGRLNIYNGDAKSILSQLIKENPITGVYWNRRYDCKGISDDAEIKSFINSLGIECKSFNGSLLWEPWEVLKSDKTPYKVFTPYYRNGCLKTSPPRAPLQTPSNIEIAGKISNLSVEELKLKTSLPWGKNVMSQWKVGEDAAKEKLTKFIDNSLIGYKENRNFPSKTATSFLSIHLHFGEISPNQIWYYSDIKSLSAIHANDLDFFRSELGWREFSHYLLYHFPELPEKNFQPKFDDFPWEYNDKHYKAWTKGMTGYPIIDAGMRELWQTGYMHNRVRMIVASFLIKNLLIDWRKGAEWFWETLLDADIANNSASWQWVAGSGADAAPYFRIFNPITQSEKFDPNGEYIRRFIPELAKLPTKYIFAPWDAPDTILKNSGITFGESYPAPIIDLSASREKALKLYKNMPI
ncbi:MAG: hypothetical protein RLZZ59_740 [Pseudomonadota bacterium]|jgi:deoxyribodipyrimidine photo-lyase